MLYSPHKLIALHTNVQVSGEHNLSDLPVTCMYYIKVRGIPEDRLNT